MQHHGFDPHVRKFFSGIGDFPLGFNMGSDSIPPKTLSDYQLISSLCTHAFHDTDSNDPDIHVLDGRMPAAKTHPAFTIHENGMRVPQCLD